MPIDSPEPSGFADFVRRHRWHFLSWAFVAIAFRLVFFSKFSMLTYDSFVYGDIAKNWLQHGVYGLSSPQGPDATFVRLPGYPIFLLLTWVVAGIEHYKAALIVQIVVDLLTCFVIADLARRIASDRAARIAFVLTALCPFFANYASAALTETWAIFFAAFALDAAVAAFDNPLSTKLWMVCGAALAGGVLLRPDGGILLIVVGGYALYRAGRDRSTQLILATLILGTVALAPLAPWTYRNWRTFHLFQPLTTLNATMPDEFVPNGFQRWVRTWIADYSSVEDVVFKVEGSPVTIGDLPPRAWDDAAQQQRTDQLLQAYVANDNTMSPAIDDQFATLARDRIRSHPVRFYVQLPLLRAADLWLRPRTEMLPLDQHWWRLSEDDPPQFRWSILLGAVNIFYVIAAVVGLGRGKVRYALLFVAFAVIRTAFLATMPNPEPRYVLECYPALIATAAAGFGPRHNRTSYAGF